MDYLSVKEHSFKLSKRRMSRSLNNILEESKTLQEAAASEYQNKPWELSGYKCKNFLPSFKYRLLYYN